MSQNKTARRRAAESGAVKPGGLAEDERVLVPVDEGGESAPEADGLAELEEAASLGSVPDLLEFVNAYPGVYKLPDEVLEAVRGGKKLMQAYAEYENARLRDEIAAQEQNRRNAERTPGSVRSDAGESDELSELLAVFDSVFR